jgi:hypothetical protein
MALQLQKSCYGGKMLPAGLTRTSQGLLDKKLFYWKKNLQSAGRSRMGVVGG